VIGNVVGNYKIIEKIGEGGMGAVYKAIDFMAEREVAVKMLRPELARQPHVVSRFRSEAKALARLNHPNIATLYSFFREGDDLFMAMEFVKGETLADLILRSGPISCGAATQTFRRVLEGISYAHQNGIVHRDIKPSNIMLTPDGSAKVMDFGIARVMGTERLTMQGGLIGTIEYMSPEQIQGTECDPRSDIYSLGIVLYEMLSGRLPFSGSNEYELMKAHVEQAAPSLRSLVPDIPSEVDNAITRALAKRPELRFQTVSEFRNAVSPSDIEVSQDPYVPEECIFRFPKDRLIGWLSFGKAKDEMEPADWEERVQARGEVHVPVGRALLLDSFATDEDMKYVRQLSNLRQLDLCGGTVSDVGIEHVAGLVELRHLDLAETKVNDAGLTHLAGLRKLRYLCLKYTGVNDAGLSHLGGLRSLRKLDLLETTVSDTGLVYLERLNRLDSLSLGHKSTKLTTRGVIRLSQALPKCKIHFTNREGFCLFSQGHIVGRSDGTST
jgi:serine/threonine protein kinase